MFITCNFMGNPFLSHNLVYKNNLVDVNIESFVERFLNSNTTSEDHDTQIVMCDINSIKLV